MIPSKTTLARIAGFMYFLTIVFALLSIEFFPSLLIAEGNISQTITAIKEHPILFQLYLFMGIFGYLSYQFVAIALFKLLRDIDQTQAWIMAIIVTASIPVAFMGIIPKVEIFSAIKDSYYLDINHIEQLEVDISQLLQIHHKWYLVSQIFWGLWLIPLGWLVYHSDFLPNFLGIMLIFGCFSYLLSAASPIMFPSFKGSIIDYLLKLCQAIGEIGLCLWLLIFADTKKFKSEVSQ